jgi:hypothetical protein
MKQKWNTGTVLSFHLWNTGTVLSFHLCTGGTEVEHRDGSPVSFEGRSSIGVQKLIVEHRDGSPVSSE